MSLITIQGIRFVCEIYFEPSHFSTSKIKGQVIFTNYDDMKVIELLARVVVRRIAARIAVGNRQVLGANAALEIEVEFVFFFFFIIIILNHWF